MLGLPFVRGMRQRPSLARRVLLTSTAAVVATMAMAPTAARAQAQSSQQQPQIDIVIAVDVSGSMRGLIDQTRLKMWDVVRLLGQAKPTPRVRVGLVSFGGKYYDPTAGYVRREIDLTTDLDEVSQRLFALRVQGSQEYVARAVETSTQQMSWSQDSRALKILFVAGNESANQDPRVNLASALRAARQRGIHVNTIFCGNGSSSEALAWRQAATIGGGEFAAIDHNRSVVAMSSPYDAELSRLSRDLSATYAGAGETAEKRLANMRGQDSLAAKDGTAIAAERAAAKASPAYNNADWDAVDAYHATGRIATSTLPTEIAAQPAPKQRAWVLEQAKQRQTLRARIAELADKRGAFLSANGASGMGGVGAATASTTSPMARPADAASPQADYGASRGPMGGAVAVTATAMPVSTPTVAAAPVAASPPTTDSSPPMFAAKPTKAKPATRAATSPAPSPAPATATMGDAVSGAVKRQAMQNAFSF